jgi:hypothetical protein
MTPKEKAEELVSKYITNQNSWYLENLVDGLRIAHAKQCALIAVDEILQLRKGYFDCINPMQDENYWQEVKKEINLL